jgi:hypothetical protein
MESFGDAVRASEAPHASDLLGPGVERVAEGDKLRQSGLAQFADDPQEAGNQFLALAARFMLFQQQVTESLFEAIDEL